MWHPSYRGSPSSQSEAFIRWLELRNLSLISEIDKPTHNCGNVLDLCFGSSQLVARGTIATVQEDLDVTSDHLPLLANVYCGAREAAPITGLRFATIDKDILLSLLRAQSEEILPLSQKSASEIDRRADQIIKILHSSFAGSAKRALPHSRGQPWWDQNCKEARKKYRDKVRDGSANQADRKEFRMVTRRAKISFFQKGIDEAANGKDVFSIAKWHKSKDEFRTPALVDPNSPDSPPAQSTEDKRDLLVRYLLSNQSEV